MFAQTSLLVLALASVASSAPIPASVFKMRREVPQEHSHEQFLTTVRATLAKSNPLGIQDPVFGLLGNAAATAGANGIDPDCLQQQTADSAFGVAKAAGDVAGMAAALVYAALERNTGSVGLASVTCTAVKATNPEVAAITRHQDPASPNAAQLNKQSTLGLAVQLASIGADPTIALKSGTFAPGTIGDPTAKGNSCDDINTDGCIFTSNLLVEDATADEISAAVAGTTSSSGASSDASAAASASATSIASTSVTSTSAGASQVTVTVTQDCAATSTASATAILAPAPTQTVTVDCGANASASASVATTSTASATAVTATATASSGANLQTFTGALGGISPPPVTAGGRGFIIAGPGGTEDVGLGAALQRSCDIQHNQCSNAANAGGGFSVGDCDAQNGQCTAAGSA